MRNVEGQNKLTQLMFLYQNFRTIESEEADVRVGPGSCLLVRWTQAVQWVPLALREAMVLEHRMQRHPVQRLRQKGTGWPDDP